MINDKNSFPKDIRPKFIHGQNDNHGFIDKRPVMKRGDIISYSKVKEVKDPQYGTDGSVGIDFFVPNSQPTIILTPGEDALIPSGIKVKLPKNTALIAFNKSGVSTKKKLIKGAEVIDFDYQGEIHIHVFNVGKSSIEINPGDKLIQFIHVPIIKAKLDCVSEEELYRNKTIRGELGFGSTGEK